MHLFNALFIQIFLVKRINFLRYFTNDKEIAVIISNQINIFRLALNFNFENNSIIYSFSMHDKKMDHIFPFILFLVIVRYVIYSFFACWLYFQSLKKHLYLFSLKNVYQIVCLFSIFVEDIYFIGKLTVKIIYYFGLISIQILRSSFLIYLQA